MHTIHIRQTSFFADILGMVNFPIYQRLPTYGSSSNHSQPSSQFYPPSFSKLLAAHQAFHGSLYSSSPFCQLFIHPVLELSKLIFYQSSQSFSGFGAFRAYVVLELSNIRKTYILSLGLQKPRTPWTRSAS